MSLMAGFDVVIELGNKLVRQLIEANFSFAGTQTAVPFEATLPVNFAGISGSAHLVVTTLAVDMQTGQNLAIDMGFQGASVQTALLTVCPLDGILRISMPVEVVAASEDAMLQLDMTRATVTLTFSDTANSVIAAELTGTPVSPTLFTATAQQSVTNFVQMQPPATVPLGFGLVPDQEGSLQPLQFCTLEAYCVGSAEQTKQCLGLFGMVILADRGSGQPEQKTETAIVVGQHLAFNIAPKAFHQLLFCPWAAAGLNVAASDMPTTCGNSSGVGVSGVTLTSLTDSFQDGSIALDGTADKSGSCYDAHASFHGQVTLAINGGVLQPSVTMGDPDVDVDIPWYCWLAAGAVLGPIGLVITGVVNAVAQSVAQNLASSALSGGLGNAISGIGLGGVGGKIRPNFHLVNVTTEGLSVQGTAFVPVPYAPSASVNLVGSVTVSSSTEFEKGTWHTKIFCESEPDDFPYVGYLQQEVGQGHSVLP